MDIDQALIDDRLARPTEGLNVELKSWIDPADPAGKAKIVRAALALRNRDGGEIVVGFNDKTQLPESAGMPADVRKAFHVNVIQRLVAGYAYDPFEVGVGFGERDGRVHPVILIPTGVRTPVAAKADLFVPGAPKPSVREGAVYVRSLRANNTVSSVEARPEDWEEIARICFNNREADFGAFFRRQLSGINAAVVAELIAGLGGGAARAATPRDRVEAVAMDGGERFARAIDERKREQPMLDTSFLAFGAWEVSLEICGEDPAVPEGDAFLSLIGRSNPSYTGWPVWLDSRTFEEERHRPYVRAGAWESLIISYLAGFSNHVDFMVMKAPSRFYLRRILTDDLHPDKIEPRTVLDPWLWVYRTAEAIAVGLAFAKALGYEPAKTTLAFKFRWTGLARRELQGWANSDRVFFSGARLMGRSARDDDVSAYLEVPAETAPRAIGPFVAAATRDLFLAFQGFEMPEADIEERVASLTKRGLRVA